MIAGVAAGFGERFDIPVPLVRVGFVVLAFFGGFGVLAYLVGWLLIPEQGHETPIAGTMFDDTESLSKWLGVGLILAAALVALSWTNLIRGDFLFAAALLGIGILLFRGDIGGPSKTTETPAVEDSNLNKDESEEMNVSDETSHRDAAPAAAATAVLPAAGDSEPPTEPVAPAPTPPKPRRPRDRSILGGLTFGAILLTLGIMAALDAAGLTRPAFSHYVAAVVIAAGAGLLVGTLWGRSYGLIAVGLLLLPVLAVSTLVRVPFGGEIGERLVKPETMAQVVSPVEMAIGSLTIDLSDLTPDEPFELVAELGIGQLTVFVPSERTTTVSAEIGIGSLDLFGDQTSGLGRDVKTAWPGASPNAPIHLELQAGLGEIRVIAVQN
jgi:phage shock protein PspC (stress-responsive transcriptional regulator)